MHSDQVQAKPTSTSTENKSLSRFISNTLVYVGITCVWYIFTPHFFEWIVPINPLNNYFDLALFITHCLILVHVKNSYLGFLETKNRARAIFNCGILYCLFAVFQGFGALAIENFFLSNLTAQASESDNNVILGSACDFDNTNCIQNVFIVKSRIESGLDRELETVVVQNPKIDTVCFDSPGGSILVAQKMASIIKSNNLKTCMADAYYNSQKAVHRTFTKDVPSCDSVCPFILASGADIMKVGNHSKTAVHAFHNKFFFGPGTLSVKSFFTPIKIFTETSNLKVSLYALSELANQTPSYDLHTLSSEEESWLFTNFLASGNGVSND
ncbi:hypothetical protein [Vibrio mediterranei]|uniref:hypothetical protein n=1 Tax=Vibrio mediterranei TaxID=689 RepID=UPI004067F1B2